MNKHTFKLTTIIFDMDGVITNTMPYHYLAWKKILIQEALPITRFDIYSREGQRGEQALIEIFKDYNKPFSKLKLKHILKAKENLFKKIVKQKFITGSRTLLKNFKYQGFTLGLVTGTSRHELHEILQKNIYDLFSIVVTADDVKKGKPNPDPYLKALDQLNTNKKDAIVIENAPFGILSAKTAGLKCIALETSLPKKYLDKADLTFSSIREMKQKINFELLKPIKNKTCQ